MRDVWWDDVRLEGRVIHWTRLEPVAWRTEVSPDLLRLRADLVEFLTLPASRRARRVLAMVRRYGPPTAFGEPHSMVPLLVPIGETSVALDALGELFEYMGAAVLLAEKTTHAQLVTPDIWRHFIPGGVVPRRTDGTFEAHGFSDLPTQISQPRFLYRILRGFSERAQCEARLVFNVSERRPFLSYGPDAKAPLTGLFTLALIDIVSTHSNTKLCENFSRCGGYVPVEARVGRPRLYCEACSPTGSTVSTVRARLSRQRRRNTA
jgi:hypothetical protein